MNLGYTRRLTLGGYNMEHHNIDIWPIPEDKKPCYINEPWLIDGSLLDYYAESTKEQLQSPDEEKDNIRVYVPLDFNCKVILRRLDWLILRYGEANEANEMNFSSDVEQLISQIEIYDQFWSVQHMPKEGVHSAEAVSLVRKFVDKLLDIPDGGAELFPFGLVDELREEYLGEESDW